MSVWTNLPVSYSDDAAVADLSDAAYRTNTELVGFLYRTEETSLVVPRRLLRRIVGTTDIDAAVRELIEAGWWTPTEDRGLRLSQHGKHVRHSIRRQLKQREDARRRQAKHRAEQAQQTPGGQP